MVHCQLQSCGFTLDMLINQIILVIENDISYLLSMIFKFLCQLHWRIIAILLNSVNFHDLGNQVIPAVSLDY